MKTRQVPLLLHRGEMTTPNWGVVVGPPGLTWLSGGEKPRPSKMPMVTNKLRERPELLLVHYARRQLFASAAIAASRVGS